MFMSRLCTPQPAIRRPGDPCTPKASRSSSRISVHLKKSTARRPGDPGTPKASRHSDAGTPKASRHSKPGFRMPGESSPKSFSALMPPSESDRNCADKIIVLATSQAAYVAVPTWWHVPPPPEPDANDVLRGTITALRSGKDVAARYQASESLAALGPKAGSARAYLEVALVRDQSAHVRKSAARALGELGDKESERVLHAAVEHDEDQFVRHRAEEALDLLNQGWSM